MLRNVDPRELRLPPRSTFSPRDLSTYDDIENAAGKIANECLEKYEQNRTELSPENPVGFTSQLGWGSQDSLFSQSKPSPDKIPPRFLQKKLPAVLHPFYSRDTPLETRNKVSLPSFNDSDARKKKEMCTRTRYLHHARCDRPEKIRILKCRNSRLGVPCTWEEVTHGGADDDDGATCQACAARKVAESLNGQARRKTTGRPWMGSIFSFRKNVA
ncbi:MAG: hypothetical protein L6R36_001760 [Xanthoria steineri]|nr:MAG: hypothetical protein L6R36_001760 [Xanthoria steineri]